MGLGAWGLGPGGQWSRFSTHCVQRSPQGDATSLVGWLISHHTIERTGFAQRPHRSLVDARPPDEIVDVEKWPASQRFFQFFTCGGTKTTHQSQSEPDDWDVVTRR